MRSCLLFDARTPPSTPEDHGGGFQISAEIVSEGMLCNGVEIISTYLVFVQAKSGEQQKAIGIC